MTKQDKLADVDPITEDIILRKKMKHEHKSKKKEQSKVIENEKKLDIIDEDDKELKVKEKKKKHKNNGMGIVEGSVSTDMNEIKLKHSKDSEIELLVKKHKKKHKEKRATDKTTFNESQNGVDVEEYPVKKHKKRKHRDKHDTGEITAVEENDKNLDCSEEESVKKHKDKNDTEIKGIREENGNDVDSLGEHSDKKRKKRKHQVKTNNEEIQSTEANGKEISNTTCNSSSQETANAEKKLGYTAEYFGEKPAKTKKKKKNEKKIKSDSKEKSDQLADPSKKDAALEYLKQWNSHQDKWKFQKVRQVWLLQNMYYVNEVPDESFTILLSYIDGLKGKAREATIADAEKCLHSQENEGGDESTTDIKDPLKYERARKILQALS